MYLCHKVGGPHFQYLGLWLNRHRCHLLIKKKNFQCNGLLIGILRTGNNWCALWLLWHEVQIGNSYKNNSKEFDIDFNSIEFVYGLPFLKRKQKSCQFLFKVIRPKKIIFKREKKKKVAHQKLERPSRPLFEWVR